MPNHYDEYDEMLNEMFPLEGIYCNPFSLLLKEGDPVAYEQGYLNWADSIGYDGDEDEEE